MTTPVTISKRKPHHHYPITPGLEVMVTHHWNHYFNGEASQAHTTCARLTIRVSLPPGLPMSLRDVTN